MNIFFCRARSIVAASVAAVLTACASGPPTSDWKSNAHDSIERAIEAYLAGNARVDVQEFARAKSEISRTGRADLLARVELMHCAGQVASLVQDECAGFQPLRLDAAPTERAYANFLAGRVEAAEVALLPPQHRIAAAANDGNATEAVNGITDPLARLVAAGVLFKRGLANPAVLAIAVETASAQGWRRPLLAWLGVQLLRAEKAGDTDEANRLRRRVQLVEGGR